MNLKKNMEKETTIPQLLKPIMRFLSEPAANPNPRNENIVSLAAL